MSLNATRGEKIFFNLSHTISRIATVPPNASTANRSPSKLLSPLRPVAALRQRGFFSRIPILSLRPRPRKPLLSEAKVGPYRDLRLPCDPDLRFALDRFVWRAAGWKTVFGLRLAPDWLYASRRTCGPHGPSTHTISSDTSSSLPGKPGSEPSNIRSACTRSTARS